MQSIQHNILCLLRLGWWVNIQPPGRVRLLFGSQRGEGHPHPPLPHPVGGSGKEGVPSQDGYRGIGACMKSTQSVTRPPHEDSHTGDKPSGKASGFGPERAGSTPASPATGHLAGSFIPFLLTARLRGGNNGHYMPQAGPPHNQGQGGPHPSGGTQAGGKPDQTRQMPGDTGHISQPAAAGGVGGGATKQGVGIFVWAARKFQNRRQWFRGSGYCAR